MALSFLQFTRKNLLDAIRMASKADDQSPDVEQARYLASYLDHAEAGTKSLVLEEPYTDRHYMEEFAGYYATAFRAPPHTCVRIHAFSEAVSESDLSSGTRTAIEKRLQKAYLGFIVVRPIPSAPIGRTVLKTYGASKDRNYGPSIAPHRVHLAGLELTVEGVAFQQQDQAVGACATTAIWTSLSKVIRADGGRAPTPLAITMQANKHVLTGRDLPATGGLELGQMLSAIRGFGYSPHVLKPIRNPDEFHAAIRTYLASGIPVILHIKVNASDGHAVAVTGFWSDPRARPIEMRVSNSRVLRVRPMSKVYVHDDRIGPYARMKVVQPRPGGPSTGESEREVLGEFQIKGWPYEKGFDWFEKPADVWHAIVPLYPKIRLSAEDLIRVAQEVLPLCTVIAGGDKDLEAEMCFALSGHYLRGLRDRLRDRLRAADICKAANFPRYLGVIRFSRNGSWLADILCDTTEIYRERPAWTRIIGLLPANPDHLVDFSKARDAYELNALVA